MSGFRSSHFPWNAFAPPIPTGPTMSGPLPDCSSVASWPLAWSYVTISRVRWMFGCAALKSETTLSSTVFCSGASPPPRQQYQRISTGPPGGTVAGPVEADAGATEAGVDGGAAVDGLRLAFEPPQAVASRASAATRTPGRNGRADMV